MRWLKLEWREILSSKWVLRINFQAVMLRSQRVPVRVRRKGRWALGAM